MQAPFFASAQILIFPYSLLCISLVLWFWEFIHIGALSQFSTLDKTIQDRVIW